ncbi:porin family protein [Myroides guanonis]|uniref:Outer membrane protein beta-barrel domain-containing protein n=1 Tax=Myroides guanonis TaxID=1150112 RepID=A0A1I3QT27_9FLAO|nr:porin family protein [Myroides guanonis]SFJ37324.1 Outer membrane protein beta-barrel domain-containing protein [Myroides guanonis]
MKKIILSAIALAAFSFAAQAQTPDLKLGAKAGVNFANLSNSDGDMKTGFHVGVLAEIFINEKFSVQPELLYSTQGTKIKNEIGETKWNTDYINVPIMAKYYVIDGLSVQAGPQVGFLVKSEAKAEDSMAGVEISATGDMKDVTQSVDFGLNFGAGYELPMGVFFDARYNLGLSKVNKESQSGTKDYKNGVIQVSVGYKF